MKIRLLLLAFLAGAFLNGVTAYGQEDETPIMPFQETRPIFLGPVIGFNKSMHGYNMRSLSRSTETAVPCPVFDGGTNSGFYVGMTYEHVLGEDYKNSNSSLIFKAVYSTLPALTEVIGVPYNHSIEAGGQKIVRSEVMHSEEVKYEVVSFEALYKLNPIEGITFGLVAGPAFDYALTMNHTEKFILTSPLNAQFKKPEGFVENDPDRFQGVIRYEDLDRTAVVADGEIPDASAFRVGLKLGAQYEYLMGRFYLVPHIFYNLGITNLSGKEDWRVSALQMGVDLRFSL